ncbi:hypothetical protein Tco_0239170, partial [Tanacetum coccineum]
TPIISQPSSSKPQKKKSMRKQRKDSAPTEPTTKETPDEAHVSTPSCDPSQSELEEKSNEFGKEKLKSRTPGFKRLRKVGSASRVESSNDINLGA